MSHQPFNSWVWRINGVLLLLAAIGVLIAIAYEFFNMWQRSNPTPAPINIADDPKGIEKWTLGRSIMIDGSHTLMLFLNSENKEVAETNMQMFSKSYSPATYRSSPSKNILFINLRENTSSWLFDTTSQLVFSAEVLPYGYGDFAGSRFQENPHAKIITYQVATKDSNGDNVINHDDKVSFAISNTDGTHYRVIVDAFDRIISTHLTDSNRKLMTVYQNEGIAYASLFQLDPFKVISTQTLPRVKTP